MSSQMPKEPVMELLLRHIDHGYGAINTAPPATRRVARAVAIGVLVVIGFVVTIAFRDTLQDAPRTERTKQALIDQIGQKRSGLEALEERSQQVESRMVDERTAADRAARDQRRADNHGKDVSAVVGAAEVYGPGVIVTVADGPHSGEQSRGSSASTVTDRDLHELVNALWQAGAEAIEIDGQRLTTTSAIRTAGEAILVDFQAVSSPYEIRAIGEIGSMRQAFYDSAVAQRFQSYVDTYGMRFEVQAAARLDLPASSIARPRKAHPAPTEGR